MRYALYLGCATPVKALKYEISARNLAKGLGIEFVDVPEFGCCGFPMKSMNHHAALLMAARNLALAEERELDIIGLCTGCVAILSEAKAVLEDERIRADVNKKLKILGHGEYTGAVKVKHFARFLYEDYGPDRIKKGIKTPLAALQLGVHYGCHYMKPSHAHGRFDDPSNPVTIDALIAGAGARIIDYPNKNLCCGLTIMGTAEDLSFKLAAEKLDSLQKSGADAMVVACPSCCIAYENNQKVAAKKTGNEFSMPILYFSQVIGLAMGLGKEELGFDFNRVKADKLVEKLTS